MTLENSNKDGMLWKVVSSNIMGVWVSLNLELNFSKLADTHKSIKNTGLRYPPMKPAVVWPMKQVHTLEP